MDVLSQFDAIGPEFQRVASNTKPAQLDDPTPCEGWAIRDVFGHMIAGAVTFAALVRGDASPAEVPSPSDDALAATALSAVADVDGAFRSPGALERQLSTPFGEMPGEAFARLAAVDLLMHTWDIANATGQQVDVPDDVVADVEGFARQAITPELRRPGLFGAEVQPDASAAPIDRLAAFTGRRR